MPLLLASLGISLGTFLIVLDYSIANVSIPYIAGDLAVSVDQGTYVITSFAVGSAIALAITGWLTKRVGLIRLFILALLGFVLFSWICGMSRTLPMLVIGRFIQGLVSGPLIPLSQTLIVTIFPPEKKQKALGFWGTVVIVAPIVGPVLGGWISYDFHWPWIFYLNIPLGLFAAFMVRLFLKQYETEKVKLPLDWIGLLLLSVSVAALQFLLDKGEQFDWLRSPLIRVCAITSLVGFVYLVAWELVKKNPLLELRLLKVRSYSLSIIYIFTMYAIYFGGVVLVPLWLQEYMGYTPIWAGIAVAPIGIIPSLFSSLIGTLTKKIGPLIPLVFSLLFFAASSFTGAFFNTDIDLFHIALTRLFFGFGILFFIVPLFTFSMSEISLEKAPSATGMFHFVRAMAGGIGTSIFTTLWIRRTIFHHSNQVATIVPSRPVVGSFFDTLQGLGIQGEQAYAVINELADKQAAVLAFNDCFYLMGWIFIAMLAILLFGKKKQQAPAAPETYIGGE